MNRVGPLGQFSGAIHLQHGGHPVDLIIAEGKWQVGSQTNAPLVLSWVGRSRAHGAQRLDTDDVLVTITPDSPDHCACTTGWPLPEGDGSCNCGQCRTTLSEFDQCFPTFESLPRVFSLQQYPSGAAVVLRPAFADAALVEEVVYELGADMNSNCYC